MATRGAHLCACSWFLAAALPRYAPWWSRATQAWFIGGYLNGIAVYGRDPVLACADVYFRAWGISETPCFFADPVRPTNFCPNATVQQVVTSYGNSKSRE